MGYIPRAHRPYARFLLSHVIRVQRWGIGRVVPARWKLYLKGGWGSGSGRVDHQVALLRRGRHRVALALFTQFDPDHAYGKQTLRGHAARLLGGLGSWASRHRLIGKRHSAVGSVAAACIRVDRSQAANASIPSTTVSKRIE
jgi:hypothetical protein